MAGPSGTFAPTPPLARSAPAAGWVYATGSVSSENQQSAMNRPTPDGFMTSPPQSVSMPIRASATSVSRVCLAIDRLRAAAVKDAVRLTK